MAKLSSVGLRTKWLWFRISLLEKVKYPIFEIVKNNRHSCSIAVLKIPSKFKTELLCWRLFLLNVTGFFQWILRNFSGQLTFLQNTSGRLQFEFMVTYCVTISVWNVKDGSLKLTVIEEWRHYQNFLFL